MLKIRSNFKWYFGSLLPKEMLFIEDINIGGMSVTNDIENVIQFIKSEVPNIKDYIIQYLDSENVWTQVILDEDGNFLAFGEFDNEKETGIEA